MPSSASQHQGQHGKPRHAAWVLLTRTKFQTFAPCIWGQPAELLSCHDSSLAPSQKVPLLVPVF